MILSSEGWGVLGLFFHNAKDLSLSLMWEVNRETERLGRVLSDFGFALDHAAILSEKQARGQAVLLKDLGLLLLRIGPVFSNLEVRRGVRKGVVESFHKELLALQKTVKSVVDGSHLAALALSVFDLLRELLLWLSFALERLLGSGSKRQVLLKDMLSGFNNHKLPYFFENHQDKVPELKSFLFSVEEKIMLLRKEELAAELGLLA